MSHNLVISTTCTTSTQFLKKRSPQIFLKAYAATTVDISACVVTPSLTRGWGLSVVAHPSLRFAMDYLSRTLLFVFYDWRESEILLLLLLCVGTCDCRWMQWFKFHNTVPPIFMWNPKTDIWYSRDFWAASIHSYFILFENTEINWKCQRGVYANQASSKDTIIPILLYFDVGVWFNFDMYPY